MTSTSQRGSGTGLLLLMVLLGLVAGEHLPALEHSYLPGWDEAVHAAVAGNLARHPDCPTLLDQPLLAVDRTNWQANHVWLHMPPLPFWQSALALAAFGRSFWALRLPSLLLWLLTLAGVYRLGTRHLGEEVGLLAACLLAASPLGWLLVQGYHFGDMTDVSLAAWLLMAVLAAERAVVTGSWYWGLVAGLAQGAGWLCKSALALPPAGALLVLWWLSQRGWLPGRRVRGRLVVLYWLVASLPALAWEFYISWRWPREAALERRAQWLHVTSNYEGHARSWDALFNDLLGNLWAPALILWCLAALVSLTAWFWRRRGRGAGWLILWCWGTLLPLMLVRTKVPALLWGMAPALSLALAWWLLRILRKPSPGGIALAATPVAFLWLSRHTPGDFFAWSREITPALAVWPHLPLQLAIWAALALACWAAWRLIPGLRHHIARLRPLLVVVLILPLAALIWQRSRLKEAFSSFASFNPASALAEQLAAGRESGAILLEGAGDGRQRPELTVSFLSGRPAEMHWGGRLERAARLAASRGGSLLATPWQRRAQPLLEPTAASPYWVYPLGASLPELQAPARVSEPGSPPLLLDVELERTTVVPGGELRVLLIWSLRNPAGPCFRRLALREHQGPEIPAWPERPRLWPSLGAEALDKLAPPGWFDGWRPLGAGLWPPLPAGQAVLAADAAWLHVPAALPPGRWQVVVSYRCGPLQTEGEKRHVGPWLEVVP